MDWFIVLGPLVALPLILLFAFVGCGLQTGGVQVGPVMLVLFFLPQELSTQGGSVSVTFQLPPLPPLKPTAPSPLGPFVNSWTSADDLTVWRSVQTPLPPEYTEFSGGGQIQCVVEYTLSGPNLGAPGSVGNQQVGFPRQFNVLFYLDASNSNFTQWSVSQIAPMGAPQDV